MYLALCALCLKRASIPRKGMVFQFLMFGKMNSRGQAGAIDILSQADRDFNCILVYQYYLKS